MSSERVLMITERTLGDCVMTLPLIELLEGRYPNLEFLVPAGGKILYSNGSRTFLPHEGKSSPLKDIRAAQDLRKQKFDVAVISKTSFRSAWIARAAGIQRRIGHSVEGRSLLLTDPVPYSPTSYEAWSVIDLARPLGFSIRLKRPKLPVPVVSVANRIAEMSVGVQPGASSDKKRIAIPALAEVVHRFQDKGFRVYLVGGELEVEAGKELESVLKRPVVNLVGKTSLNDLMILLSQLKIVVGADTGVMHISSALGATTVQAFGPTKYAKWGNAFGGNQVLASPTGDMKDLDPVTLYEAVETALKSI